MITNACTTTRLKEELASMDSRIDEFKEQEGECRNQEVEVAKNAASSNSIVAFNKQLMQQIENFNKADAELAEEKNKT